MTVERLMAEIDDWGFGYLLTVSDDSRTHLLALRPHVFGDALRFDAGGQIVERRDLPIGIRHVRDGRFDAALAKLIAGWDIRVPRIASGMIGSRLGCPVVPELIANMRI